MMMRASELAVTMGGARGDGAIEEQMRRRSPTTSSQESGEVWRRRNRHEVEDG
jgi:hypothetical protein